MTQTAAARYAQLAQRRQPVLERARDNALLTIPRLVPLEGMTENDHFPMPHQSTGARVVNNLTNKESVTLLPPGSSFFRHKLTAKVEKELAEKHGENAPTEIESALVADEKAVTEYIEYTGMRPSIIEAIKQKIVAGNALLKVKEKGGIRLYKLPQYCIVRSPTGEFIEIVVKEAVAIDALPDSIRESVRAMVANELKQAAETKKTPPATDIVDVYTHVKRVGDRVTDYQEVKGRKIPGSTGDYPADESPWIPLRFYRVDGEDYGRSLVEEYYGYLYNLEVITKAIAEAAEQSAKVVWLVDPNGVTKLKALTEAKSGDFVSGLAKDVEALQMQKHADLSVAMQFAARLTEQIEAIFLVNPTAQTQGRDRVTREEIRFLINEQNTNHAGSFSLQAQELLLPLVRGVRASMVRQNLVSRLPSEQVKTTIVTGLEALGRNAELNKLDDFLQPIIRDFGPQAAERYVNMNEYMLRRANAIGLDARLIKTTDQIAQEDQQAQQQALLEKATPNAVTQVGKAITQGQSVNGRQQA